MFLESQVVAASLQQHGLHLRALSVPGILLGAACAVRISATEEEEESSQTE